MTKKLPRKRSTRPTRARRRKQHAAAVSKALQRRARTPTEPPPPVTGPNGERIRPSHWRYAHAKLELTEKGEAPTVVRIAKALHIDRCTLYEFLRRWPWLDAWVNSIARDAAVQMHGLILKRHGMLAIQGSVQSADLFCKMDGGHYTRSSPLDAPLPAGGGSYTLNLLIPRPEALGSSAPPAAAAPTSALIPRPAIPTVALR